MFCLPIINATKGAYTVEDLESMPFWQLLARWEAVNYAACVRWLASEPKKYTRQDPRT